MKKLIILLSNLFIFTNLFADCSRVDCGTMLRINPPIESHFEIPSGYQMIPANVGPSYSWGGNLNTSKQNTELCCNDADQFFSILSSDHKKQCTIDNGVGYNVQNISVTQRNDLSPGNNMNCQISKVSAINNHYLYKITVN